VREGRRRKERGLERNGDEERGEEGKDGTRGERENGRYGGVRIESYR